MTQLAVRFAGMLSPNPFWVGPGPATRTKTQVMRAFEEGWGGVVWSTLSPQIAKASTAKIALANQLMIGQGGDIGIIDPGYDRDLNEQLVEISEVKRLYPENIIIGSIIAELNKASWSELAKKIEGAGCDGIEICLRHPFCLNLEQQPSKIIDSIKQIVGWVKKAANIPIIIQLCPDLADTSSVVDVALNAGLGGATLIGPVRGIGAIDLTNCASQPSIGGASSYIAYHGSGVKPMALAAVADVAKREPEWAICGAGGISSWREVVEFMLLGASVVQVSDAVLKEGYRIIGGLRDGLESYLKTQKIRAVASLRGKVLQDIGSWGDPKRNNSQIAVIDQMRCIGCGLCFVACRDGAVDAITLSHNDFFKRYKVEDKCSGCGLCSIMCPVSECIIFQERRRVNTSKGS